MSTSYPPYYAYPSAPPLQRSLPDPPRLHWGWVAALNFVTRGLFLSIWLFVQAYWVKKVRGRSYGFWLALVNMLWLPMVVFFGTFMAIAAHVAQVDPKAIALALGIIILAGTLLLYTATVFVLRSEMEAEPIGMSLSGVMSFFFGPIYFQYHLREYGRPREGEGLSLSRYPATEPDVPTQHPVAYPTAAEVGVVYPAPGGPYPPGGTA